MSKMVCNPRDLTDLWDGHEIGDPFLMRFNGTYYLYCSSHGGPGIKCWSSENMIDFTYCGLVCEDDRIRGAYAPEVMYNAGKFWMVTSPVGSGHYMLRADSPLGPFEVISENYGIGIDGSLFLDDQGKSWFYRASHDGIRVHAMPDPGTIDPHSEAIKASFLGYWTEGPMVVKRDGRWFLTDTGNHVLSRGYRVDYCVSHDGPVSGYRKMKDTTLLIETRDEFHALGHSSTCMGPDMDSLYIVYHKNILDAWNRPSYRSLNMDRLFFNGDRMYTSATWWNVKAPTQPVCACRDGEGMTDHEHGAALPMETGATYSAEINLTLTENAGHVFFSCKGENGAVLTIHADHAWELVITEKGERRTFSGKLPETVAMDALMTVRVSLKKGKLELFLNTMTLLEIETVLGEGAVGLDKASKPGFVGFSHVAQGSDEGEAAKHIPGTFDAVHCREENMPQGEGETGCKALRLCKGDRVSYVLTTAHDGAYHMALTMPACKNAVTLTVNGQTMTAAPAGAADDEGMERRYLGEVALTAGESVLTIEANDDVTIDRLQLLEADAFVPAQIVADGQDVAGDALHIIGHKARKSMLHKFSGYTCAEGYGEAFFGGQWHNFQVRTAIHIDPCSPDAQCQLFLRSRQESWHPHQVGCSRIGYCVRVKPGQIELCKQDYCERVLATRTIETKTPYDLTLICRVNGNQISVLRETALGCETLITVTDPMAYTCGRMGFSATGDGVGFTSMQVESCQN